MASIPNTSAASKSGNIGTCACENRTLQFEMTELRERSFLYHVSGEGQREKFRVPMRSQKYRNNSWNYGILVLRDDKKYTLSIYKGYTLALGKHLRS